jgi:NADH-quinone oxidoreductase subunit J
VNTTALYILYGFLAVGAGGLYLCLPRVSADAQRLRGAGVILGAAALAGVGAYLVQWIGAGFEGRTFLVIFAVLAVAAAARVVTHPRPVYSAVYFILVVLAVTGLCVLAAAEFLAAALLIIYGGAILVTYIFVIMLAQQAGQAAYDARSREPLAAVLMGFMLAAAAAQAMTVRDPIAAQVLRSQSNYRYASWRQTDSTARQADAAADGNQAAQTADGAGTPGNVQSIGTTLMTTYVMAVEVAGLLLLVAVVGAIAVARKRIEPEDMTAEELEQIAETQDLQRIGREAKPF